MPAQQLTPQAHGLQAHGMQPLRRTTSTERLGWGEFLTAGLTTLGIVIALFL